MANPRAPNFGKAGDRNLIALLGLKLLLLAFFIVLTSISEPGVERTEAVLQSVNESFEGLIRAPQSRAGPEAGLGLLEGVRPLLETIGRLFDSKLPVVEMNRSDGTLTLIVELSDAPPLAGARDQIEPGLRVALVRAAKLLAARPDDGLFYQVDVIAGRPALADEAAPGPAGAFPSRLVELFVEAGVPADRVSAGIDQSDAYRTVLVVRFYRTAPVAIDFGPAPTEPPE